MRRTEATASTPQPPLPGDDWLAPGAPFGLRPLDRTAPIAPVDVGGTLEGALVSLRNSVVSIAAGMDALG